MRSIPYLCLLVLANGAGDSTAGAEHVDDDTGRPRLRLSERAADFGECFPGRVEHTFGIQNTGDAPLRIDRVKPS